MVVSIEHVGDIAVVRLNNPPVNALSQAMRQGLLDAATTLDAEPATRAVVLIAEGRTFIAGADVSEFNASPQEPHLPDVIARIEAAAKPWVAAIHGAALGGGLEVTLGCQYRIASPSSVLGLPEVKLGVVPGAGASVRLPRLIKTEAVIELVLSGEPIPAKRALQLGLIDQVAESPLLEAALAVAAEIANQPRPQALSTRRPMSRPDAADWDTYAQRIAKTARGENAPRLALDCLRRSVEADTAADTAAAFAFERETFLHARTSDQARALRHIFFAERAAGRPPEVKGLTPRPVNTVAVIGGGTMGAGIAAAMHDAKLPVVLVERDDEALARAKANLERIYDAAVKRGRLSAEARAARVAGTTFTTDYDRLADIDLAVEAVFEDLTTKRAVFAQLEMATRPDAVLATNTSYLDPRQIAAATAHPERVLGLHFFSPANVMKLLEVVPTETTSPEVLATGFALAKVLGKIPVLAGICDGFIGNRILKTTRSQAERLLLSGSTPADVDRAMQGFGMAMGPFQAQDLGGLDIAAFQRKAARARGETPFAPVAERLCAINRLGQKTSGGWYDYTEASRSPIPSQTVASVIAEESAGYPQLPNLTDQERVDRIILPMVNEAAKIRSESIAKRTADIDLVEVHGYGFPRWRGGLMHYAEARGLSAIVESLTAIAEQGLGDPPCEWLTEATRSGRLSDD